MPLFTLPPFEPRHRTRTYITSPLCPTFSFLCQCVLRGDFYLEIVTSKGATTTTLLAQFEKEQASAIHLRYRCVYFDQQPRSPWPESYYFLFPPVFFARVTREKHAEFLSGKVNRTIWHSDLRYRDPSNHRQTLICFTMYRINYLLDDNNSFCKFI